MTTLDNMKNNIANFSGGIRRVKWKTKLKITHRVKGMRKRLKSEERENVEKSEWISSLTLNSPKWLLDEFELIFKCCNWHN